MSVTALANNNPKLQYLALDECELITGKSVKTLAEKCPLLEHISMDGCYQVRDCKGISGILICQQNMEPVEITIMISIPS